MEKQRNSRPDSGPEKGLEHNKPYRIIADTTVSANIEWKFY